MHTLLQDLRYALRTLAKKPAFTIIATLTLALGIGANSVIFSMVSAFLLRPPSGHDPERIAAVSSISPTRTFQPDASPVSAPTFLAWRTANTVFSDMAASDDDRTVSLSGGPDAPEAMYAAATTPNYFDVLGVVPALGRTFAASDDQSGRDHVAILSHGLWERRFASDPSLVGRTIRLNREDYTVIGVMPSDFHLLGFAAQLWTPLALDPTDQTDAARKLRALFVFARFKPSVTLPQARAEFAAFASRAQQSYPEIEKGWGATVRTLPDFLVYSFGIRTALALMMTAVGFVLMPACANVAGLLLAHGAGRRKELTIRVAIGASRFRIIRQLLTEGLVIALLGGASGLLLASWGVRFVRAGTAFNEGISAVPISLDGNVLLFALGVSLVSALLCGLAPAFSVTRSGIDVGLKEQSRGASASRSHGRLRSVMVTAEIALALFLLVGTGLLIHGILLLRQQNLGFRSDHLLTAGVSLDSARYKDSAAQTRFLQDTIAHLQEIPGAVNVAAASHLPAAGLGSVTLRIEGQPDLPNNQRLSAREALITADYFRTTGIPLLRGRAFAETDNASAPRVVVVNQEFVHRLLHDLEPLGKQIRIDVPGSSVPPAAEIVGVVPNVKTNSMEAIEDPEIYEPLLQRPATSFWLMVKTDSDENSLASALRAAVAKIDADLPLATVMSMTTVLKRQEGGNPLFMRFMSTFAFLALTLAAIGIYGLVAYSTTQRTHEIGIRMAMGAGTSSVMRMILWQGLRMAVIGATIGLLLALPLPKLFDAVFDGAINVREPRLFFFVPLVILSVALVAAYVPARRATRIDPLVALRYE